MTPGGLGGEGIHNGGIPLHERASPWGVPLGGLLLLRGCPARGAQGGRGRLFRGRMGGARGRMDEARQPHKLGADCEFRAGLHAPCSDSYDVCRRGAATLRTGHGDATSSGQRPYTPYALGVAPLQARGSYPTGIATLRHPTHSAWSEFRAGLRAPRSDSYNLCRRGAATPTNRAQRRHKLGVATLHTLRTRRSALTSQG